MHLLSCTRLTLLERPRRPKREADDAGDGDRDDARAVGRRAEAAGALRCAFRGACKHGSSPHSQRVVSGMGREGAQIRVVPAAARPRALLEVVVHLGAPCPHWRKPPATAGAGHTAVAGVRRLCWKSAYKGEEAVSEVRASVGNGDRAHGLEVKVGIDRELLTRSEAAPPTNC